MAREEYLDRATRHIPRADRVREELAVHLQFLVERFMSEGHDDAEATELAMRQLGEPDRLRRAFKMQEGRELVRVNLRRVLGAVCFIASLRAFGYPPALLYVVAAMIVYALMGSSRTVLRHPAGALRSLWRRHTWVSLLALVFGILIGSEPIWAAGIYSPWTWSQAPAMAMTLVVPGALAVTIAWRLWRYPSQVGGMAGVAFVTFWPTAMLTGLLLWHIYPVSPSPYVDWFVRDGAQPLALQNSMWVHPAGFAAVIFLGTLTLSGLLGAGQALWREAGTRFVD